MNVTLFDENGNLLARKAIVKFVGSDLDNGETREVEDTMDYPTGGQPVFVAVDEGQLGTASDASPPDAPAPLSDSSTSSVGYSGGYHQAMMDLKDTLESRGYTVYWPHMGNQNTLGVTVQDSTDGLGTMDEEKVVAKEIAGSFNDVRSRYNKSKAGTTIVQFEPSGTRMTVTDD